jgi:N-acetylglutamate synthase-like GNAT family acetyltransferase
VTDELSIRCARPVDDGELAALYRAAYEQNAEHGFPSSMCECAAEDVAEWRRSRTVIVAERGGELVGAVQLLPRDDWDVPELGRLAVHPRAQGQGLGDRLRHRAETHACEHGCDRLKLRTLSGHPFLEDWYESRGYERVGIERLAHRPYDAPIMEKRL